MIYFYILCFFVLETKARLGRKIKLPFTHKDLRQQILMPVELIRNRNSLENQNLEIKILRNLFPLKNRPEYVFFDF